MHRGEILSMEEGKLLDLVHEKFNVTLGGLSRRPKYWHYHNQKIKSNTKTGLLLAGING